MLIRGSTTGKYARKAGYYSIFEKKINKCERCKQASEKIKHLDELPVDWTVIYFSFLIC